MDISESDPRWERIDPFLFEGKRILAHKAFMEDFGVSLREAIDCVLERFSYLAAHQQERFQVPLAGYWDDVYT